MMIIRYDTHFGNLCIFSKVDNSIDILNNDTNRIRHFDNTNNSYNGSGISSSSSSNLSSVREVYKLNYGINGLNG